MGIVTRKICLNESVFKMPHYVAINVKREVWLSSFLDSIIDSEDLATALDVGCGQGYFSHLLHQFGLKVIGVDARSTNVEVAKKKYPMIPFFTMNIESTDICNLGCFDLVLCMGLLYHLENPFSAIRNLSVLTKRYLIIESMIAPSNLPISILSDEVKSEDQSLNFIAFIPSMSCLVKMLYRSGFNNVYTAKQLPDHPDFKKSFVRKQRRTVLITSKSTLNLQQLVLIPDTVFRKNWWQRLWFYYYLKCKRIFGGSS